MGVKISIIVLVLLLKQMTQYWIPWPGASGGVLFNAMLVGAVLGNFSMGLQLGGIYELMNIGLNPLGESVVPNYNLGSIVGTYFAITVNKDVGTAMGIVVATLATMLNTFSWYPSFFFKSAMEKALKEHKFEKVMKLEVINWLPSFIIGTAIPVIVILSLGEGAAQAMIKAVPDWLVNGFKVAGNALPAMGFAIVLRSLGVEKNIEYLIIGFCTFAFLKVGTVGASLIGLALALLKYRQLRQLQTLENVGVIGGVVGDE
ncbi:MAG: PTS sugar transporter subunit IIC [Erysipelotrichaceae bacterium]|jgi:PTS system mannose-specific IIC component